MYAKSRRRNKACSRGTSPCTLMASIVLLSSGWQVQGKMNSSKQVRLTFRSVALLYLQPLNAGIVTGSCEYGSLPGTMEQQGEQHLWRIYNNICEPFNLLPHFLGLPDSTAGIPRVAAAKLQNDVRVLGLKSKNCREGRLGAVGGREHATLGRLSGESTDVGCE